MEHNDGHKRETGRCSQSARTTPRGERRPMTTTDEQASGDAANAGRVQEIQAALRASGLDGWLFYDFRQSDPLAYRILKLDPKQFSTRRWFYFVPAEGEPVRINHAIEQGKLDRLPGRRLIYSSWGRLNEVLRDALSTSNASGRPRIAMQYSPENSIPYISRVDAGT